MRVAGMLMVVALLLGCGGGPTGGGGNGADGPVASVQITGGGAMETGGSRTLTAVLRNAESQVLTGRAVAWSVDPSGVLGLSSTSGASISVEALDEGTAVVTATSEGESDTESITVTEPPPAPSTATVNAGQTEWIPNSVTIANGGTVTWNNNSGVTHSLLFSSPPAGVEDDASFVHGESHSFEFNAGATTTFNYLCNIHPGMNGSVVVQVP